MLPLVPREKRPLTKNGLLDASTDPTTIDYWWHRWPTANIGLRTGLAFDALDIDGEVGRASLEAKTGPGRHTGPVSRTGRGEHWLFAPTHTNNRAGLLPKLDWRGVNGYIVAAPSIHPDGHEYAWDPERGPDRPLPDVPDWLAELLTPHEANAHVPHNVSIIRANAHASRLTTKAIVLNPQRLAILQSDIVAMARELGYTPVPRGPRFVMTCIFHAGDNEASLTLYPADNSFYCYGCGAWGDTMNLRDNRPGGKRG